MRSVLPGFSAPLTIYSILWRTETSLLKGIFPSHDGTVVMLLGPDSSKEVAGPEITWSSHPSTSPWSTSCCWDTVKSCIQTPTGSHYWKCFSFHHKRQPERLASYPRMTASRNESDVPRKHFILLPSMARHSANRLRKNFGQWAWNTLCSPFPSIIFHIIAQNTYCFRFTSRYPSDVRPVHVTRGASPGERLDSPAPVGGGLAIWFLASSLIDDTPSSYCTQERWCDLLWPIKCGQPHVISR